MYKRMESEGRAPTYCSGCEDRHTIELYKKFSCTDKAMDQTGVPKAFAKAHVDDFAAELIQKLPDKIEAPGLFVHGDPSIGKTHLAAALFRRELKHHVTENTRRDTLSKFILSGMWANTHSMLMEIRQVFNKGSDETEVDLHKRYIGVSLLVMDDFGTEKQSEWAMATLCNIIDGRMNLERPTIITSNLSPKDLAEIDTRIVARLSAFNVVKFKGRDRRKAKGKVVEL